jgi:hypothetical protein
MLSCQPREVTGEGRKEGGEGLYRVRNEGGLIFQLDVMFGRLELSSGEDGATSGGVGVGILEDCRDLRDCDEDWIAIGSRLRVESIDEIFSAPCARVEDCCDLPSLGG